MEWCTEEYSVGEVAIDQQHHGLFLIANGILHAPDREATSRGLIRLFQFTGMHFHDEELLMARYEYAGLFEHHKKHEELIERMGHVAAMICADVSEYRKRVSDLMLNGLLVHIIEEDRRIGFPALAQIA